MAKTSAVDKEKKRRALAAKGKFFKVRLVNRCNSCGRPHAVYRFFGLCRICLRNMASQGKLPGVTKSSW